MRKQIILLRTYRIKLFIAKVIRLYRVLTFTGQHIPDSFLSFTGEGHCLKIGMIDFSYHRKTRSSSFFIDLLRSIGSVVIFWDNQWNGGNSPDPDVLKASNFDVLVVWQGFYYHKPAALRRIGCPNTIIVPMYDDSYPIPDHIFLQYKEFRWISFSKTFQDRFEKLSLTSKYFCYFPAPSDFGEKAMGSRELHGFFWQRNNDITWLQIRKLIEGTSFISFHLHLAIDPLWYKAVMPESIDTDRYNITISTWFDKREDYLTFLSGANVFFAPRLYEGIGMPFLEAMAMGKVVVAPDHPTMNEYIVHDKNGLLYDPSDPQPLDFSHASEIAETTATEASFYHDSWVNSQESLINWIKLSPGR